MNKTFLILISIIVVLALLAVLQATGVFKIANNSQNNSSKNLNGNNQNGNNTGNTIIPESKTLNLSGKGLVSVPSYVFLQINLEAKVNCLHQWKLL